jgi:hypothetical protein
MLHSMFQLCSATYCGTHAMSIKKFRDTVTWWMSRHKESGILITLVTHSTPDTGELVYAVPGSTTNKYGPVNDVSERSIPYFLVNIDKKFTSGYLGPWG